jgi:small subunit ribosomal protein S18
MNDRYGDDRGYDKSDRGDRGDKDFKGGDKRGGGGGGAFRRRKVCRFCVEKEIKLDYKDGTTLKLFISERGKVVPRRISGNCAKHQRVLSTQLKRARALALIPYAISGT